MANYTEKAIFRAFEELLEEKPFDKITVSAIVSKSEVSANTFYYHFQDTADRQLDRPAESIASRHAGKPEACLTIASIGQTVNSGGYQSSYGFVHYLLHLLFLTKPL